MSSNSRKAAKLGIPFGTASNRLRKMILYKILGEVRCLFCFRCTEWIDSVDELSIDHEEPWEQADDPKASFFDLGNISFSHLRCNKRAQKSSCPIGHLLDPVTRHCQICRRAHRRRYRENHREEDKREYRRSRGWDKEGA